MEIDFKAIGNRIKKVRLKAGFSQEQLAEILNVTPSYMSHLERGTSKINLTKLITIANTFSLDSMDSLLCDNIKEHRSEFYNETREILMDCDVVELRVLVDQLRANKENMRKLKAYYQK